MTKPATLPRWATDLTNNTPPSSGQQDTGWTPGQDGVSDYDNWAKYWTYKWFEWIDGGMSGDFLAAGSTTYTGTTTVNITGNVNNFDPLGTGSTVGLHTLYLTAGASTWQITGMVGGVNGREIDVINTSGYSVFISHEDGGSTAANRFTFPSTLTGESAMIELAPGGTMRFRYDGTASRWRMVAASGCRNYQKFRVPVSAAHVVGGTWNTSYVLSNTTASLVFPVELPLFSILDTWKWYVKKVSNGTVTVGGNVGYSYSNDETIYPLSGVGAGSTDTSSANAPGYITLTDSNFGSNALMTGGSPSKQYYGTFSTSSGGSDLLMHLELFAWTPF